MLVLGMSTFYARDNYSSPCTPFCFYTRIYYELVKFELFGIVVSDRSLAISSRKSQNISRLQYSLVLGCRNLGSKSSFISTRPQVFRDFYYINDCFY